MPGSTSTGRAFNAREVGAWQGLLATHARLTRTLNAALEEKFGLAITEFEVLIMLCDRGKDQMSMSELAEFVTLTPSGVSRLIDRMAAKGLVTRSKGPGDGRMFHVAVTEEGRGLFAAAAQMHRAGVRRHFLSKLSAAEMDQLAEIWSRVTC